VKIDINLVKMSQITQNLQVPRRSSHVAKALDRLLVRGGIFRTADAEAEGITQQTLSRMAAAGDVVRLGHGLFQHPEASVDPTELDYVIACARFGPLALIGGLTALFHYQLSNEAPSRVWVVVPPSIKTRSPLHRCLRSTHDPQIGVEEHPLFRIATIERAVAEALTYATKVGVMNAVRAARIAISSQQTTDTKVYGIAEQLGVRSAVLKHWEALIAV
jgi:predicted transcriptional regulator of viral defense system